MRHLLLECSKLGSRIPTAAFSMCASAILAERLGNFYGQSYNATPIASAILDRFSREQWQYYLNQCLPGDVRILDKLAQSKPLSIWHELVTKHELNSLPLKNQNVQRLIEYSEAGETEKIRKYQQKLLREYYGVSPSARRGGQSA